MEWAGSISWTVVVWVRRPLGRVRGEAVIVVQLFGAVGDVSITPWVVVIKTGGESTRVFNPKIRLRLLA